MKITTRIYLSIGFILIIFSVVTVFSILQSFKVEAGMQRALFAADITRRSEALQKSFLDIETGMRGFLIAEKASFLEHYYLGLKESAQELQVLKKQAANQTEKQMLQEIDSLHGLWRKQFAEPVIAAKLASLQNPAFLSRFDSLNQNLVVAGKGKAIMDQIRDRFTAFDKYEAQLKNAEVAALNRDLEFNRLLSFILTLGAIAIGLITAVMLGRTIHRRLSAMIGLARQISEGNFESRIQDNARDELSKLSGSLDLMAVKLNSYFTNLTKTNRELDQFAYVVSHDLKAPLRAINNLAEWVSEDISDPDPEIQHKLRLLRGRAQRMENLINGILEYSKIGRKQVIQTTFNVKDLLLDIADMLAPPPHIRLKLPETAPTITTEKIFLQQVLTNLISNGIKYNNKAAGKISIEVTEAGNFLEFTVTDNGPGIPEAFHDKIFGIFRTMEARDTRESTGVGLAIIKKIIDEKGGTIKVLSEADRFTSFIFTWPYNQQ